MNRTGGGALNHKFRATHSLDMPRSVKARTKEAETERHGLKHIDGFQNREVENAIVHLRAGRDVAVVAELIRIGDCENESGAFDHLFAATNDNGLRLIGTPGGKGGANIGAETASGDFGEALADLGIEAEPHDIEKGPTIGLTGIDQAGFPVEQGVEGVAIGFGDAEVSAESVSGTAGNQSESSRAIDQGSGYFVHRSITPDGDDRIAAFINGLPGKLGGMARPFRCHHGRIELMFPNELAGAIQEVRIPEIVSGVGVKNKSQFQSRMDVRRTESVAASSESRVADDKSRACHERTPAANS